MHRSVIGGAGIVSGVRVGRDLPDRHPDGQHAGFDRVVFEFSGGTPSYAASVVKSVYSDAKGDVVPLPGQVLLRVVFRGATARCPGPGTRTGPGGA